MPARDHPKTAAEPVTVDLARFTTPDPPDKAAEPATVDLARFTTPEAWPTYVTKQGQEHAQQSKITSFTAPAPVDVAGKPELVDLARFRMPEVWPMYATSSESTSMQALAPVDVARKPEPVDLARFRTPEVWPMYVTNSSSTSMQAPAPVDVVGKPEPVDLMRFRPPEFWPTYVTNSKSFSMQAPAPVDVVGKPDPVDLVRFRTPEVWPMYVTNSNSTSMQAPAPVDVAGKPELVDLARFRTPEVWPMYVTNGESISMQAPAPVDVAGKPEPVDLTRFRTPEVWPTYVTKQGQAMPSYPIGGIMMPAQLQEPQTQAHAAPAQPQEALSQLQAVAVEPKLGVSEGQLESAISFADILEDDELEDQAEDQDGEKSFDGTMFPQGLQKPKEANVDAQILGLQIKEAWQEGVLGHMPGFPACRSNFEVLMFRFEFVNRQNVTAMVTFKHEFTEASVGFAGHAEELIAKGYFTQLPFAALDNNHHLLGLASIVWGSVGDGSQLPYPFAVFTYACKSGKHHSRIGGCARRARCPGIANVERPCRMCHEEACILLNNRGPSKRNYRRGRKTKKQAVQMVPAYSHSSTARIVGVSSSDLALEENLSTAIMSAEHVAGGSAGSKLTSDSQEQVDDHLQFLVRDVHGRLQAVGLSHAASSSSAAPLRW